MDFERINSQLRNEINSATKIVGDLLIKFQGSNLAYIYAKGSAIKPWEDKIDYVPVLSDLDIHYGVHDKEKIFASTKPIESSLAFSAAYEDQFTRDFPNKIHIPRLQIICTNLFKAKVNFVQPLKNHVLMLFGEFPEAKIVEDSIIRKIDKNNLSKLKTYLDLLPDRYLDKVGLDYWAILRQLNWMISPAPVRILTQLLPNPMEIWTWNRTRIKNKLDELKLNDIASAYEQYYLRGWNLFESKFSNSNYYRDCLIKGTRLLELCFKWFTQNCN